MKDLVRVLSSAYGPSGDEGEIRDLIRERISAFVGDTRVDALGNLIATRKGNPGAKRVMVVAHMDEPGVIVTHVEDEGFLRFDVVGRVFRHILLGSRVTFKNGVTGIVSAENPKEVKDLEPKKFFIDVGMGETARDVFRVADVGVLTGEFREVGRLWVGKALDNRVGCAILIATAAELAKNAGLGHEVNFVFASQSEVGVRGSRTSAYGISPDIGLAVEVVEAMDTPKADRPGVRLGEGVGVKVKDAAVIAHRGVRRLLEESASREGIAFQREVREMGWSDAAGMQLSRAGVPAGALSVPCRYRLSGSEAVDPSDVEACSRLLTLVLRGPLDV